MSHALAARVLAALTRRKMSFVLADELGASVEAVNEALRELQGQGLVMYLPPSKDYWPSEGWVRTPEELL